MELKTTLSYTSLPDYFYHHSQLITNTSSEQLFLSDPGAAFSSKISWTNGERLARYAMTVDHGKVVYAAKEPGRGITVSGVEAVLANL
jgi:alkyl hydroperoxide reductase 1